MTPIATIGACEDVTGSVDSDMISGGCEVGEDCGAVTGASADVARSLDAGLSSIG